MNALLILNCWLGFLKRQCFRKQLDLAARYGKGSWVVVTGASDGIGAVYCREFAAMGFNLVMISRTTSKLNAVEAECKKINPSISTKVIVANFFENNNLEFYDKIFKQIEGLDVSIFIANAGLLYLDQFHKMKVKETQYILDLNIYHLTVMTKRFETILLKRNKRSAIINLSSIASIAPSSWLYQYGASKAYVSYFARSQQRELAGTLIDFQVIRPSGTITNLYTHTADEYWINQAKIYAMTTAEKLVDGCLRDLGQEEITSGDWFHEFSINAMNFLGMYGKPLMREFTGMIRFVTLRK